MNSKGAGLLLGTALGGGLLWVLNNNDTKLAVQNGMENAIDWIQMQGQMAPVYYSVFLATWITCLLPSSVVEIVPGYLFGMTQGFLVSLVGKVIGSMMSSVLARTLLKSRVQRLLRANRKLFATSRAIEEEGIAVMILARMSYIPMVFKNYGIAVLDVSISSILLSTVVAGIPFSLLWSFVGASSHDLQSIFSGQKKLKDLLPEDPALLGGGLLVVLVFALLSANTIRNIKKRVDQKLAEAEAKEPVKVSGSNEDKEVDGKRISTTPGLWKTVSVVVFLVGGALYWHFRHELPSLTQVMKDTVDWILLQGPLLGPIYYTIFLALWVTALLPCSILEMVPGYLFGFQTGVFVSIVGKNLGTVLSLLIGRYFLRDMMQQSLLQRYPKLLALEKAVNQGGFPVLIMIRCAYLPMLVKNYGLSCLDIPLGQVWIASVLASFPFAALWTFLGASATNMADIFEGRLRASDVLPDNVALVGSFGAISLGLFFYYFSKFMSRFRELLNEIEQEEKLKKAN